MSPLADGRRDGIAKRELEFWTQNSQLVQVPWGEDVLGETARATSAKDGLGGQGGGWPGDGHGRNHKPNWLATDQTETTTEALELGLHSVAYHIIVDEQ